MQRFYKKCAVLYDLNGEPMFVLDVLDFVSEKEYIELKEKARKNYENKVKLEKKENETFKADIHKAVYDLAVAVKNYTNK